MTERAGPFSFPRARRLDGPHAFAAVFAHQCRVSGALFQIYAKPNGASYARLGIVVAKSVMPSAVDRNYTKRLAREVFRAQSGLSGLDFVVRPRAPVNRGDSQLARNEIQELLNRARRKCRPSNEDALELKKPLNKGVRPPCISPISGEATIDEDT